MNLPEKFAEPEAKKRIFVHPDQITQPDRRPWSEKPLESVIIRFMLMSALFISLTLGAGILILGLLRTRS